VTEQFLSVDPLVDSTNQPYVYAGDDPTNATDPLGLFCLFGSNPGGGCRGASEFHKTVHAVSDIANGVRPILTGIQLGGDAVAGLATSITVLVPPAGEVFLPIAAASRLVADTAGGLDVAAACLGTGFGRQCWSSGAIYVASGGLATGDSAQLVIDSTNAFLNWFFNQTASAAERLQGQC
jgi:hypothetical protein